MTAADAALDAPRLRHVPALDGLRGLAVAGVIAFHAGYLRGGFLGVDLFFVLSGFLITSLLVAEHAARGRIGLRRFWARRARRLLPALLVVLAAVAGYAWITADPAELGRVRGDALATLGYVANWREVIAGGSYWDLFAVPSPLEHTWSLAIEEQFYVVWPLVVAGVLRVARGSRRVLLGVTGLLLVGSAVTMVVLHRPFGDPSRVYFGTDTRASGILVGAALALVMAGGSRPSHRRRRRADGVVELAAGFALVAVLASWAAARGTSDWLYEGGLLASELGVGIVIWAVARPSGGPAGWLVRTLSWRPLRGLGLISYGLYLWHWPVFVVCSPERTGIDGPALAAVRIGVSIALAVASYRLVEQPVRRGAPGGWRVRALTPAALGVVAVVIIVATVGGVSSRLPASPASAAPAGHALPDVTASASASETAARATRLLVVGDAGGRALAGGLRHVGGAGIEVVDRTTPGCDADCLARSTTWRIDVESERPHLALVAVGWPGSGPDHPCDPSIASRYRAQLDAGLAMLAGRDTRVAVATVPYVAATTPGSDEWARVDCLNRIYQEAAAARAGAMLVDLFGWTCPGRTCLHAVEAVVLRPDGVHFGAEGAGVAARWLLPQLVGTDADEATRVVVAGDSTSWVLAAHFPRSPFPDLRVTASAWVGCGLAPGRPISDGAPAWWTCEETAGDYRRVVARDRPDVVIVMAGMWEILDHEIDGRVAVFGDPAWEAAVETGVESYVDVALGQGARVVLLTAPCYHLVADDWLPIGGRNDPDRIAAYNRILGDVAAAHAATVDVIDFGSHVCPDGPPAPMLNDGVHLSVDAAADVWAWLVPQLGAA